eukprot:gene4968-34746_t
MEVGWPHHIVEATASGATVNQAKEAAARDVMNQLRQRVNEHRCRSGLPPGPKVGIRYHQETQLQAKGSNRSNVSLLTEYALAAFKPTFVLDAKVVSANGGFKGHFEVNEEKFEKVKGQSKNDARDAAAVCALQALSLSGGPSGKSRGLESATSWLEILCKDRFKPIFYLDEIPSAAEGFTMHCEMDGIPFPSVTAGGKTAAKEAAARVALEKLEASPEAKNILDKIRRRADANSLVCVPRLLQGPASSEGEQMVELVQEQLQRMYEEADSAGISLPSASRSVVVAAIIQKQVRAPGSQHLDKLSVVAIATGNKSLHSSHQSNTCAGQHILDSHAEVLARRAFVLYLAGMLARSRRKDPESIFKGSRLRNSVSFHLYVSTAPCGDARRFCNENKHALDSEDSENSSDHKPDFSNPEMGKLVPKIKDRMTGSPTDSQKMSDSSHWHSMTCSDKVLKWATHGLQGGLLASKLEGPVKLSSVIIGSNFERRHVERALCCRSSRCCLGLQLLYVPLPESPTQDSSFSDTSLNWFAGAETETTLGPTGQRHGGVPSRLCKASMARSIASSAQLSKPLKLETYVLWKNRLLRPSSAGVHRHQHAATYMQSASSWFHLCKEYDFPMSSPTAASTSGSKAS